MTHRPRHQTLGPRPTAVLVALLRHHVTHVGNATYGDLMTVTGLNRRAVADALTCLKAEGLVTWEPGGAGTIRPTLAIVLPTATPQA